MREYIVVGVYRLSGTSKKTGQPFSMTRLYLLYEDPTEKNLVGQGCMEVTPYDTVFKDSRYEPVVGDVINLYYEPGYNGQARISAITKVG